MKNEKKEPKLISSPFGKVRSPILKKLIESPLTGNYRTLSQFYSK